MLETKLSKESVVSSIISQITQFKLFRCFPGSHKTAEGKHLFDYVISHENCLIVVKFTASWCTPCKLCEPAVEKIKLIYPEVLFLEVDVDRCEDIADCCDVTSLPTFVFYVDGREFHRIGGFDEKKLNATLESGIKECKKPNMFNIKNKPGFSHIIAERKGLVVCWATASWCKPCQKIAPEVSRLANKYRYVTFLRVDIDGAESVADHLGARELPGFYFFRDGKLLYDIVGGRQLEKSIKKYKKLQTVTNEVVHIRDIETLQTALEEQGVFIAVVVYETYNAHLNKLDIKVMDFAEKHKNIRFYHFDTTDCNELKCEYGIEKVPAIVMFYNSVKQSVHPLDNLKKFPDIQKDVIRRPSSSSRKISQSAHAQSSTTATVTVKDSRKSQ